MRKTLIATQLIILILFLTACSGIQTRRAGGPSGSSQSDSPFDTDTTQSESEKKEQNEKVVEDIRRQRIKPKIAVVLGPGAFKTFAYPSFLKAMTQSGVKIDEVVGIEWGALSAAFYANNAKPHEAEWKIFKLKKEEVENSSLFGNSKSVKVSNFRKYLKANLGEKLLSDTKIPFQCPVLRLKPGTVDWSLRGSLWKKVETCLASAPNFQPVDETAPSLFSLDQVARNLKRKGYGIVVLVNVLGSQSRGGIGTQDWVSKAYWSEARRHIWQARSGYTDVIQIDTSRYGAFDFNAKNGLKDVGEKAGKAAARELVDKYKL